jgi:hypothetical protein
MGTSAIVGIGKCIPLGPYPDYGWVFKEPTLVLS